MVKVHNTLSRAVEEMKPLAGKRLSVYVCGLTTYDYSHLGHARTYVAFDIIIRYLKSAGYDVRFVQNVTDIDDKILRRAKETGEAPLALSAKFDRLAREDLKRLNVMPADVYPKVSETLPQIIDMVGVLVQKGFAYKTEDGVYFEVAKFREYGKLSGQKMQEVKAGARIAIDEKKKAPEDFALWKFADPEEWGFDSPWGRGRPGWHIECSAMAKEHLGGTVDIHGGARDLIFPHHENEIAQSEAANGRPFVRYWLHTGFLTVNGEKMAKSLGNFVTIRDALKEFDANSLRMFFAMVHYRSPIDYSEKAIEAARNTVSKMLETVGSANVVLGEEQRQYVAYAEGMLGTVQRQRENFDKEMEQDFNTPEAAACLIAACKELAFYISRGGRKTDELRGALKSINYMLDVFGIDYSAASQSEGGEVAKAEDADVDVLLEMAKGTRLAKNEVEILLSARLYAREKKNFEMSDRIRRELGALGIEMQDLPGKIVWKRKG